MFWKSLIHVDSLILILVSASQIIWTDEVTTFLIVWFELDVTDALINDRLMRPLEKWSNWAEVEIMTIKPTGMLRDAEVGQLGYISNEGA